MRPAPPLGNGESRLEAGAGARAHDIRNCSRPRWLKCYVAGLLCGSGALRGRAWPAIRAEHGHLHAAILLPVVPGLFVVHWLVFAQSHALYAVHGHGVLRYAIGLPAPSPPPPPLPV